MPCALITVKKIEADERRPSRQVAERLADLLLVSPGQRDLFLDCARGLASPLRLALDTRPLDALPESARGRLPAPVTSFIGRDSEIAQVLERMRRADVRLLTLTGPGGVGKTRLALESAEALLTDFADGARFVDLAAVRDEARLPAAVADALAVRESRDMPLLDTLRGLLRPRQILLVLDNFEHLLGAAPLVSALLAAAPRVKVLATSRAPLRLSGEHEFMVEPLSPTAAAALFADRAAAVLGAGIDRSDEPAVSLICSQLDGLPLAIELAAARVRRWPPSALLPRLASRLAMLSIGPRDAPARQQTLRNALDWSFDLLSARDQRAFARFGVFVGGWNEAAASAICGHPAADSIAALIDQHLIQRAPGGDSMRCGMLDTIREYAQDRLDARGDGADARRCLLAWQVETTERLRTQAFEQGQPGDALAQIGADMDNIRSSLGWALSGAAIVAGAQLAGAMTMFWFAEGRLVEGRLWLDQACAAHRAPDAIRARALYGAGVLAWQQGDLPAARLRMEACSALWRAAGITDERLAADATHLLGHILFDQRLYFEAGRLFEEGRAAFSRLNDELTQNVLRADLGLVAYHTGDSIGARAHFEAALATFRRLGAEAPAGDALIRLGDLSRLSGDDARAEQLYEEGLLVCRGAGARLDAASALHKLGHIARRKGDLAKARDRLEESLRDQREFGNRQGIIECLAAFAGLEAAGGRLERAALLFGAAQAQMDATGLPLAPADQAEWARDAAHAREQLGEAAFADAFTRGARLTITQAGLIAAGAG